MHLSSFGLILLDGTVNKPEPGLDFAGYQIAMSHYGATLALKSRLKSRKASVADAAPTAHAISNDHARLAKRIR